jgi:hypothetical protein
MGLDEIRAQHRKHLSHLSDTVELKPSQSDMSMSHVSNFLYNKKTNPMTKARTRFTYYPCLLRSTDAQHWITSVISRTSRI